MRYLVLVVALSGCGHDPVFDGSCNSLTFDPNTYKLGPPRVCTDYYDLPGDYPNTTEDSCDSVMSPGGPHGTWKTTPCDHANALGECDVTEDVGGHEIHWYPATDWNPEAAAANCAEWKGRFLSTDYDGGVADLAVVDGNRD
jgi:hypothetical protein